MVLTLTAPASVRLELFDVLGRRLRVLHEDLLTAGAHTFALGDQRLASGLYLVRASGPRLQHTQPITVMRYGGRAACTQARSSLDKTLSIPLFGQA